MSVLSKDLAKQIAKKLTQKSKDNVDFLLREYQQGVADAYEVSLPNDVLVFYKKYSKYTNSVLSIRMYGNGFNHEVVNIFKSLPNDDNSYYATFEPNAKVAEKLVKAKQKYEKAKKEYNILLEESEQALLTLKTYNNIRKELPEAAPYLPPPLSNALVVNFDSLKKRLNKQPEIKKEVAV